MEWVHIFDHIAFAGASSVPNAERQDSYLAFLSLWLRSMLRQRHPELLAGEVQLGALDAVGEGYTVIADGHLDDIGNTRGLAVIPFG